VPANRNGYYAQPLPFIPGLAGRCRMFPNACMGLQAHGMSARDYCLTTLAIAYAEMPRMPAQFRQANSPPDPNIIT